MLLVATARAFARASRLFTETCTSRTLGELNRRELALLPLVSFLGDDADGLIRVIEATGFKADSR